MAAPKFQGPGHWRSQAEEKRSLQDNVFAALDEHARRMHDLGMDDAEDRVRKAMDTMRENPEKAADLLREISADLMAQAPAYGHGMAEIARRLPEMREAPGHKVSDDDGIPGHHPH